MDKSRSSYAVGSLLSGRYLMFDPTLTCMTNILIGVVIGFVVSHLNILGKVKDLVMKLKP